VQALLNLWAKEPARIVGIVVAVIALLVSFGVQISGEQQAAIVGVVTAIVVVLGGEVTRSQVYSPNSVDKIIEDLT
jgi:predicted amino acid-binding ACT domain protein